MTSEGLLPTTPIETERYAGPLYLSDGLRDEIWSAAMTERLRDWMRGHGREPEVHLLADQGHTPEDEDENACQRRLIAFLRRPLERVELHPTDRPRS